MEAQMGVLFLRKMTGFGMIDCKKALQQAQGDIKLAMWFLQNVKKYEKTASFVQKRPTQEEI